MIKKSMGIMAIGLACLSGCVSAGLFSQGENASYAYWNNASEDAESVEIIGLYQNHKKLLISSSHAKAAGWNTRWFAGGNQFMSDTGHKVPDEVEVSWRKLPPPGAKPYTGQLMGPYRVEVRSRIPEEALKLARREGYSIGIEFSIGKEPVMLCWGIVTKEGGSLLGTIMSGGQCNPEDVAWRKDIDWHKSGVWFPEKP